MSYIGNTPGDKYLTLEKQTFTTSATDTYTLDRAVSSVNDIELFLNNVRQEPTEAYTISGTTLTLASPITSSDSMYCIYQGRSVGTQAPATGSVTNAMLAGSIANDKLAGGIESSKLAFASYPYRNLIINGDMSIAQRGTSASGKTSDGYYFVDRWKSVITAMGTWTFSQSTTVPTGQGFGYSSKWDCTTADASPSASDRIFFKQSIEGQMLQQLKKGTSNAESITISFWVRSNKTGTYIVEIYDHDNSRHINKSYTINSADTWEKKTLTFTGDTTGTITNDNGQSLQISWWLGAGSTYTSGSLQTSWGSTTNANRAVGQVNLADAVSNNWYITGVQLEVGTSASDFEFLPHDINLFRCQRYFTVINNNGRNGDAFFCGFTASSTAISGVGYSLATPLRIGNPTITKNAGVPMQRCTVDGFQTLSAGAGTIGLTAEAEDSYTLCINLGGFSGMTSSRPAVVSFPAATNAVTIDAEL